MNNSSQNIKPLGIWLVIAYLAYVTLACVYSISNYFSDPQVRAIASLVAIGPISSVAYMGVLLLIHVVVLYGVWRGARWARISSIGLFIFSALVATLWGAWLLTHPQIIEAVSLAIPKEGTEGLTPSFFQDMITIGIYGSIVYSWAVAIVASRYLFKKKNYFVH